MEIEEPPWIKHEWRRERKRRKLRIIMISTVTVTVILLAIISGMVAWFSTRKSQDSEPIIIQEMSEFTAGSGRARESEGRSVGGQESGVQWEPSSTVGAQQYSRSLAGTVGAWQVQWAPGSTAGARQYSVSGSPAVHWDPSSTVGSQESGSSH